MAQTWAFGTFIVKDQAGAGNASIVINAPSSLADGDLLIGFVNGDAAQTQSGPSGWTQLTGSPQSVSGSVKGSVWYKIASGEGASWTWTSTGGLYYAGFVARYVGLKNTPQDVSNGAANASTSTVTAPAVTTTALDDLVARICGTSNAASCTFASGTSRINAGSVGDLVVLYDSDQATAATTGTDVATGNVAGGMVAFTGTFFQLPTPHAILPIDHRSGWASSWRR